jgi:hypothetical protein
MLIPKGGMAGIAGSYRLVDPIREPIAWQVKSLLSAILAEANLKPIRFVFESIAWLAKAETLFPLAQQTSPSAIEELFPLQNHIDP